jgi:hypothetical protein
MLIILAVLIVIMLLGMVAGSLFTPARWHKRFTVGLGLDLSSGTTMTLPAEQPHSMSNADYNAAYKTPEVPVPWRKGARPAGDSVSFSPQPYQQLASVYRSSGQDDEAKQVSIAAKADRRRWGGLKPAAWWANALFDVTIKSAYRSWRAVAGLLAVYVLAVRVGGDAQDMHGAAADLNDEQAIQTPQGYRTIHVEEVSGEHRRCLSAREDPPAGVGMPLRCRRNLGGLPVASRSISAAISVLTGGRPARFG